MEEAAKGGPVIYENFGDNIAYKLTAGEGDMDAALKSADRVVKHASFIRGLHQLLWRDGECSHVISPAKAI